MDTINFHLSKLYIYAESADLAKSSCSELVPYHTQRVHHPPLGSKSDLLPPCTSYTKPSTTPLLDDTRPGPDAVHLHPG